jgi:hypothetical protein
LDVITLTTDFGMGKYVAAIKGIILGINPGARIVDVDHNVRPQNIREGAYVLFSCLRYFPPSIHMGVVDPGVGAGRRNIIVECTDSLLVGPDNGLLIPASRVLGLKQVWEVKNPRFMRPKVSPTFHGRDIFAPVAAHLSLGVAPAEVGAPIEDFVGLDFGSHSVTEWEIRGQVIYVDRFGNLITNIPREAIEGWAQFGEELAIQVGGRAYAGPFQTTYSTAPKGSVLLTISSSDLLEVSVNMGSASQKLGAREGFEVVVGKT